MGSPFSTGETPSKALGFDNMMDVSSDRAQTTAEYGLILSLVLVAVIAAMIAVGDTVVGLWTSVISAWPG